MVGGQGDKASEGSARHAVPAALHEECASEFKVGDRVTGGALHGLAKTPDGACAVLERRVDVSKVEVGGERCVGSSDRFEKKVLGSRDGPSWSVTQDCAEMNQ